MFAQRLKQLRQQHKLTQQQLADATGVGRATLAHYEAGTSEPGLTNLIKLADYFGISLDSLAGRPTQLHFSFGQEGTGPDQS
ncbi:MAG: helix-turn-helix transcriptional regulator [Bacillota bacterium]|jgi:transcriptional regulator with XRE-family HTH domain